MTDQPKKHAGPIRIPPSEAEAEALERIAAKRQLQVRHGDVLIVRELVPRVSVPKLVTERQWRFRVYVYPDRSEGHTFNSFQHAASEAEHMGVQTNSRVIYIEDDVPGLMNDYRRHPPAS